MRQPAFRTPEKGKLRNEPIWPVRQKGRFAKRTHLAGPALEAISRNKATLLDP